MKPSSNRTVFPRFVITVCVLAIAAICSTVHAHDLRGEWRGEAKGSLFGAEGSVNVTQQKGEDFSAVVEGGNWLGRASFDIRGKIRGSHIFGTKEGNTFQGALYADGTIRGTAKLIDGSLYRVILQRSYQSWGGLPYGGW
jgi:hypothetical protein